MPEQLRRIIEVDAVADPEVTLMHVIDSAVDSFVAGGEIDRDAAARAVAWLASKWIPNLEEFDLETNS